MIGIIWTSQSHYDAGIEKLKNIVANYKKLNIQLVNHIRVSRYMSEAVLDNGDIWQVVKTTDNARGRRCNISYIDSDITLKMVNTIIYPVTTLLPYQAIQYIILG